MRNKNPIVAILSPSQNAYSETFIQAHRAIPNVDIKYYYGGLLPKFLEGKGNLLPSSDPFKRIGFHIRKKIRKLPFTLQEAFLMRSFEKEKVDCVLAEYGPIGVSVFKVCQRLKLPLIVYFRGYDASNHNVLETYKADYHELFEYASKVMCVSHNIMKSLAEMGCAESKLMFHSSAPNNAFYEIEPGFEKKWP